MPFQAKVSAFRTGPYEPGDLAQMEEGERKKFASGYYEKVLAEEIIAEFESDTVGLLGERIVEIAEANKLRPLIVTTTDPDELPLKHSYLTTRSYVPDDEQRIFELIVFGPKDPVAWQQELDNRASKREAKRLSPSEQQEFKQKAVKRMVEETEKTVAYLSGRSPGGPGLPDGEELRTIYAELQSKRGDFATDEEFANYFVSEFGKWSDAARARRREELIRKPPYYASQMSLMLNDGMTVHCRIVGKEKDLVYKHLEYYKNLNNKSEHVYSIDNDADDGMHVSFVYGKDFDEQKTA
jgi:hypothetical protein